MVALFKRKDLLQDAPSSPIFLMKFKKIPTVVSATSRSTTHGIEGFRFYLDALFHQALETGEKITMKSQFVMMVAFATVAATGFSAGTVTGKVNFTGKAPKAEVIKMNADPYCMKANAGKKVLNEDVEVNANKTLAGVFVYITDFKGTAPAAPATPLEFDQENCVYKPLVFGIRTGQGLKIVNSDSTLHNVHAMPKGNAGFNMGMATKGQSIEKKFTKAEKNIHIKCDVHGWMSAYGNVVDHPYFAVTDSKGEFTLKDVPPGEYTIEATHHKLGDKTAKVTVKEGATEKVDFTIGSALN